MWEMEQEPWKERIWDWKKQLKEKTDTLGKTIYRGKKDKSLNDRGAEKQLYMGDKYFGMKYNGTSTAFSFSLAF